jgi:hypothetical protein
LVTLDSPGIDDDTANRVLGITKPQTVFNPVRLDDIATAHGLIPGTVGIIDNQRLLDALSGIQGGYLGQIIDDFAGLYGASENVLSGFHAPGCYSKAALVTDLWPGTALGIPVTDQTGGSVNLRLIGEISYTDTLVSLERLRSPAARTVSEPGSILSIGVGLDLPALRRLVDHLEQGVATTSTFSCPGLVSVVERLTNFISAWRESFGGGSDGEQEIDDTELEYIKGLTASIYPIKPSADSPAISGKAVVTLTAEHPEITRQMLYRVLGFDTNAKTGSGGETVSLSRDGMPGLSNVRAMLRENELILLTGDAKFPEEEGTTQTASPGLFALHYQGEGLSRAMELTGRQLTRPAQSKQRATLLAMAKHLRNTGFDLELRADVVETGINLDLTAPVPE